jgi:hypothetical protein
MDNNDDEEEEMGDNQLNQDQMDCFATSGVDRQRAALWGKMAVVFLILAAGRRIVPSDISRVTLARQDMQYKKLEKVLIRTLHAISCLRHSRWSQMLGNVCSAGQIQKRQMIDFIGVLDIYI